MKIHEKRIQPAYEFDALISRKCDICGKVAKTHDWDRGYYEVNETEISVKVRQNEGHNFPEGGSGTEYDIDLCPDCFKDKLVPWLKSQNPNIQEKDWDW